MDGIVKPSAAAIPASKVLPELVAFNKVTKKFGHGPDAKVAIQDVTFLVEDLPNKGELVTIVGPSGCGKSTLLRIIAGLGSPSAGTIDWPSAPHAASGEPQPDLGFVFQDPTLMPWSNALRNTMLPLTLAGVGKNEAEARAAEMLALVGLKGFEKAYPRELSGGMKKRVAIARALVMEPQLMLYDEPTSELDPVMSATIIEIIATLKEQYHVTSIVVSHDRDLALSIGDRVGILMGGKLISLGPPSELRTPKDPRVADFLNPKIDLQNPRFKQLETTHE